jgi:hypothetical protein
MWNKKEDLEMRPQTTKLKQFLMHIATGRYIKRHIAY